MRGPRPQNISREAQLRTDESRIYGDAKAMVAGHESVKHGKQEYVRGDVRTNSAEGFFSISKRGMRGVYQRCGEKHLHRYLAEFDLRYKRPRGARRERCRPRGTGAPGCRGQEADLPTD